MALTSTDINNQRFSIDRKGYDVDEVDVFLERVADELDDMNGYIAELEAQGGGLSPVEFQNTADSPVPGEGDTEQEPIIAELEANLAAQAATIADLEKQLDAALAQSAPAAVAAPAISAIETEQSGSVQADLDERDARIAELEAELEGLKAEIAGMEADIAAIDEKDAMIANLEAELDERKSESDAISQALVVAQQSAAEIVEKSEKKAEDIVSQAKEDAEGILQRAREEKQKIIDATADYREKRNEAQDAFKATLEEIIDDANSKLLSLTSDIERRLQAEREMRREAAVAPVPAQQVPVQMWAPEASRYTSSQQAPINAAAAGYQPASNYVTPAADAIVVNPSQASSTGIEKDMSGYGDTGIYDFDDLD